MSDVLTLPEAEDLASRTLAAIKERDEDTYTHDLHEHHRADRERVASDLAGLRHARFLAATLDRDYYEIDTYALRCSDGLLRTATLYGVTP